MRALRPLRELDAELRLLAEAEAAARLALDRAMVRATPADELDRLRAAWITANDRLADAIGRPFRSQN